MRGRDTLVTMDAGEAKWTLGDVEGATVAAVEEGFLPMTMTGAGFLLRSAGMMMDCSLVVRMDEVML